MGGLRKICFKGKGQALIEVAIFGAILLTVLSFLIRYGMVYNQRQSLDMRAFRKALSESAATDRPDAEATIYLVEDKHIPDAGDMFGVGDVHTTEARASVVWGNTLQEEYEDGSDLPRIQYIINEQERAYTTAGYAAGLEVPACLGIAGNFFVTVPNYDPIEVTMSDLRLYEYDEDYPAGARIVIKVEDEKIDIITGVWNPVTKNIARILYAHPAVGGSAYVGCFALLDPDEGEINRDYMVLNRDIDGDGAVDVGLEEFQGLLPSKQVVERGDSLKIEDSSTNIKSTTANNTSITVTHTIKHGASEKSLFNYTYRDEEGESWSVSK